MTQSETSLNITVAREFAKNYRLFHRKTGELKRRPEETVRKRDLKKVDYSGFS